MSMADRDGFIWYDGKLVPWREATTHVLTHSLHYGLAVFEGVRAYNTVSGTAIFHLDQTRHKPFGLGALALDGQRLPTLRGFDPPWLIIKNIGHRVSV